VPLSQTDQPPADKERALAHFRLSKPRQDKLKRLSGPRPTDRRSTHWSQAASDSQRAAKPAAERPRRQLTTLITPFRPSHTECVW